MSGIDPSEFYGADVASRYDFDLRGDEEDASAFLADLAAGRPTLEFAIGTGASRCPWSSEEWKYRAYSCPRT